MKKPRNLNAAVCEFDDFDGLLLPGDEGASSVFAIIVRSVLPTLSGPLVLRADQFGTC